MSRTRDGPGIQPDATRRRQGLANGRECHAAEILDARVRGKILRIMSPYDRPAGYPLSRTALVDMIRGRWEAPRRASRGFILWVPPQALYIEFYLHLAVLKGEHATFLFLILRNLCYVRIWLFIKPLQYPHPEPPDDHTDPLSPVRRTATPRLEEERIDAMGKAAGISYRGDRARNVFPERRPPSRAQAAEAAAGRPRFGNETFFGLEACNPLKLYTETANRNVWKSLERKGRIWKSLQEAWTRGTTGFHASVAALGRGRLYVERPLS